MGRVHYESRMEVFTKVQLEQIIALIEMANTEAQNNVTVRRKLARDGASSGEREKLTYIT